MTTITLYALTEQYRQLIDLADDPDPEAQRAFADTLEALDGEIDAKILACARVHRQLGLTAAAIRAEEERLEKRRKTVEASAERLKEYMRRAMKTTGKCKVADETFTVRLQLNPPKVEVTNEQAIPRGFYRTPQPVLDKVMLAETLKLGHPVAGAELVRTESLRIV